MCFRLPSHKSLSIEVSYHSALVVLFSAVFSFCLVSYSPIFVRALYLLNLCIQYKYYMLEFSTESRYFVFILIFKNYVHVCYRHLLDWSITDASRRKNYVMQSFTHVLIKKKNIICKKNCELGNKTQSILSIFIYYLWLTILSDYVIYSVSL